MHNGFLLCVVYLLFAKDWWFVVGLCRCGYWFFFIIHWFDWLRLTFLFYFPFSLWLLLLWCWFRGYFGLHLWFGLLSILYMVCLYFAVFFLLGFCNLISPLVFSILIKEDFELIPWHPLFFHDEWYYRLHQSLIPKAFDLDLWNQSLDVLSFDEYYLLEVGLFEQKR